MPSRRYFLAGLAALGTGFPLRLSEAARARPSVPTEPSPADAVLESLQGKVKITELKITPVSVQPWPFLGEEPRGNSKGKSIVATRPLCALTTIDVESDYMVSLRSRLRQKLLGYYFTNLSAEHYLRELAQLLGVDPANLSRELAALTRQGLFVSRSHGRQKYFHLNRDYPLYEELRRIVFKTIRIAGRLREVLANTPGIKEAYLYGSYARDQQDAMSDIDVLIVGETPTVKLEEKIGKLERTLRREINYTLMTEKEFKARRAKKDLFLRTCGARSELTSFHREEAQTTAR